ncbi:MULTISPECIES: DNA polymerase III subunit gamma/tau [Mesorhizobium]|uniref:DNA polymerase III subunit gamma/tau n=1 Tax=Mesorhizobium denitrificans TaxID=2294114 RepID=A0A371XK59_9HYPH|nr:MULTISPECIES: DNA polymerase III subunit gamma/tau [Mesorhizobium]RFC69589.1 DNA polymerase III subunit gamma/tau [Mesorhizobium denitrificans]
MSDEADHGPDNKEAAQQGGYRVLARKYRPRDFTGLIGQEPMVRTLTNAFATGRIAQAWMLTGVRGVGKTTTARILARALNYKTAEVDAPSVDMPIEGENCRAIMEGRHVDVIEMDAASHTGIDDIRDIIDRVRYAPVSARYKVYIIDEVHMLSTQAFNGLLKTLEEPPPHVKFIFATTEIRKVPITVLSRCQRFDLRRIDAALITDHLGRIAGLENVQIEDEALAMVARAAEGSMRDAQSILDQAIAHGAGTVTAQAVRDMLGLADRARVVDLFEVLMKGDVAAGLAGFRAQYDTGADPVAILTDLAEFTHLVTRLRFVPSAVEDASLTETERKRGAEFAETLSVRVLSRAWQMLLKAISEVQASNRPAMAAEMALIRLAHAADLPTLDEALKSLEGQEGGSVAPRAPASNGGRATPNGNGTSAISGTSMTPSGGGGAQTMRLVQPQAEPAFQPAPAMEPEVAEVPVRSLADIVGLADSNRDMKLKVAIKRYVRPVRLEPGRLVIALADGAERDLPNELSRKLKAWTGRTWMVSLSQEAGGQTLAEEETAKRETAFMDARSDPAVAAILSRFPGARIIDVRIPDAPEVETVEDIEPSSDDDEAL